MGATSAIGVTYGSIAMFGVAMIMSGVSQMLGSPSTGLADSNPADKKVSYMFNGPVNTVAQGGPIPVGYGEMIVGSVVIDSAIDVNEVEV
jgi:predicted phage tail protein